ncbi:MAG: PBP1A family penicillin-binding protein [bacterium]|nr:PBP1A family penicillin-binding protein [bacterium]
MRLFRSLLTNIGKPLYLLLQYLFMPLRPRKRIKVRPTPLPVVIYHSSSGQLKNFLKRIYPAVHLLARIHPPRLPFFRFKVYWRLGQMLLLLCMGVGIYFYIFKDLPPISTLTTQAPPLTTHIRDRNGVELYKIYHDQNRTLVPLEKIPLSLRQATIAIEDAEFYQHSGFSVRGIMRAISRNLEAGETVEGGSTITQQLVKTALLTPEQSFRRKLRELILAVAVEIRYSKDDILETYLNRVGFGGAAYGVEEAAQTYFDKSVGNLTLAESALLAGLPASPTTYSPFGAHPELAKERQKEVLRRMVSEGYISWDQAETASSEELHFIPQATNILAPHFVMYIKDLLAKKYGTTVVEQGGLDVITTLDLATQQIAQTTVTTQIAKVKYLNITNGAALVTNPQTGEILAMVGSQNYFDISHDGNVNVTLRPRQPGSSIKPINYALAFGRGFTPASTIDDSPITYKSTGQPNYSPVNYDGKYHGRVTLRTALASSYNIPAVKLLAANGVDQMIALGQKMGITTWSDTRRFGLSLTLGGGEVTMADLAVAYGTFANAGLKVPLQPILEVRDASGRPLEKFRCPNDEVNIVPLVQAGGVEAATEITTCESDKVLDPRIAFMISDVLSDNTARTPAFGPSSDLNLPKVAVKTGTTNNLRDNWTIGYSPDRLVAVWVGNNNNSPMSYVASGVTGASPIWRQIMNELVKSSPSVGFSPPANLVQVSICTVTGDLACASCPSKIEYFLPGTEPKKACNDESMAKYREEKTKKDQEQERSLREKILEGISTP